MQIFLTNNFNKYLLKKNVYSYHNNKIAKWQPQLEKKTRKTTVTVRYKKRKAKENDKPPNNKKKKTNVKGKTKISKKKKR